MAAGSLCAPSTIPDATLLPLAAADVSIDFPDAYAAAAFVPFNPVAAAFKPILAPEVAKPVPPVNQALAIAAPV